MKRVKVLHRYREESEFTLVEMVKFMAEFSESNPGKQVFFDGDRFAICCIQER
ncbi:MAG: hypothetical protein M1129_02415 [Candidatus Thermoplasmatota archaeon]|nr:hypothetical protein [Candidatus Thermoplasmatota archaeon]MCL5955509.1 hypothetical protein [Candidatus Thermoplasmatota archaeon]